MTCACHEAISAAMKRTAAQAGFAAESPTTALRHPELIIFVRVALAPDHRD